MIAPLKTSRLARAPRHERPQERLVREGPTALREAELLALLLRSGLPGRDVLTLAEDILAEAGGFKALLDWDYAHFLKISGIGPARAAQLASVIELSRRLLACGEEAPDIIRQPAHVQRLLAGRCRGLKVEQCWCLSLNRKQHLLACDLISSGTATASLVHPREVFRKALASNATSVLFAHNHPSGDPTPSGADLQVTRQLSESAKVLGLGFADHVILGSETGDPSGLGYYSFRDAGLL